MYVINGWGIFAVADYYSGSQYPSTQPIVENNLIFGNQNGGVCIQADLTSFIACPQIFVNNTIQDNNGNGLVVSNGNTKRSITLTGNTITGNIGYPVQFSGTIEFDLTDNTNTFDSDGGNGVKLGIAVSGTIADVISWQSTDALGVPFPYIITGTLTVNAGAELNVPGDTIFKCDSGAQINIYGTANLFSGSTFTSIKDDRIDSIDSGGDGPSIGSPGDWNGITLYSPMSTMGGISIQYATTGLYLYADGVSISPTIQNCKFISNQTYGLRCYGRNAGGIASPTISNSHFLYNGQGLYSSIYGSGQARPIITTSYLYGNTTYAINNTTTSTISATACWWGSENGPTNASNPGGDGDPVSSYVNFSNWLQGAQPYVTANLQTTSTGATAQVWATLQGAEFGLSGVYQVIIIPKDTADPMVIENEYDPIVISEVERIYVTHDSLSGGRITDRELEKKFITYVYNLSCFKAGEWNTAFNSPIDSNHIELITSAPYELFKPTFISNEIIDNILNGGNWGVFGSGLNDYDKRTELYGKLLFDMLIGKADDETVFSAQEEMAGWLDAILAGLDPASELSETISAILGVMGGGGHQVAISMGNFKYVLDRLISVKIDIGGPKPPGIFDHFASACAGISDALQISDAIAESVLTNLLIRKASEDRFWAMDAFFENVYSGGDICVDNDQALLDGWAIAKNDFETFRDNWVLAIADSLADSDTATAVADFVVQAGNLLGQYLTASGNIVMPKVVSLASNIALWAATAKFAYDGWKTFYEANNEIRTTCLAATLNVNFEAYLQSLNGTVGDLSGVDLEDNLNRQLILNSLRYYLGWAFYKRLYDSVKSHFFINVADHLSHVWGAGSPDEYFEDLETYFNDRASLFSSVNAPGFLVNLRVQFLLMRLGDPDLSTLESIVMAQNDEMDLVFEIENSGAAANKVYLSVSLLDSLQIVGEVTSSTGIIDTVDIYPPGSLIWAKDDVNSPSIVAADTLVDVIMPLDAGEQTTITIRVKALSDGLHYARYRTAAMADWNVEVVGHDHYVRYPETSFHKDQQGLEVLCTIVEVPAPVISIHALTDVTNDTLDIKTEFVKRVYFLVENQGGEAGYTYLDVSVPDGLEIVGGGPAGFWQNYPPGSDIWPAGSTTPIPAAEQLYSLKLDSFPAESSQSYYVDVKGINAGDFALKYRLSMSLSGLNQQDINAFEFETYERYPSSSAYHDQQNYPVNQLAVHAEQNVAPNPTDVIGPGTPVTVFVDDPSPPQFGMPCVDNNGDTLIYVWKYVEPHMVLKKGSDAGAEMYTIAPDESWVGETWNLKVTVTDGIEETYKLWEIRFEYMDQDLDGLPDSWEMDQFGNLSRDGTGDFDNDQLIDSDEYAYGTDPTVQDSDFDGLSDGWEVGQGMNPASPDTDGDQMPDNWEVANNLNPLVDDSAGDPDGDGISNINEYRNYSNPQLPAPTADFTTVISGIYGKTVEFTYTGTGACEQWIWDFGDDTSTSSEQNPTHEYAEYGIYEVSLYVRGGGGSDTTIQSVLVDHNDTFDFGDSPDPSYPTLIENNGARHLIDPVLYLGASVDADEVGQPDNNATGDDNDGNNDDDGVVFTGVLNPGGQVNVTITASASGKLDAWVDFNGDGDWADAEEQIFVSEDLTVGANGLYFMIPGNAVVGQTFARFRFSTAGGLSYDGLADDGEVEDYAFTIIAGPALHSNLINWNGNLVADFGDNGMWYHNGTKWNWMTNDGDVGRMMVWDGKLVVDFGAGKGIWYYDGAWNWMTNSTDPNMMIVYDNGITEVLVVDFGSGQRIYTYDGSWHWFKNKDGVADMTVWNNKLIVDFGSGRGVYNYDGTWNWMSNKDDVAMMLPWDNGITEVLVVDFGGGRRMYTYDGAWNWFTNKDDVHDMVVWNQKLVVDFGGGRLVYTYDGSWSWLTNKDNTARMVTWRDTGSDLAFDFGSGRNMYNYNGAWAWMKNANNVPEMLAWSNRLAVDFGPGIGVYNYNGSWHLMKDWSTAE